MVTIDIPNSKMENPHQRAMKELMKQLRTPNGPVIHLNRCLVKKIGQRSRSGSLKFKFVKLYM